MAIFPSVEDIVYTGIPILPNGGYTVYEIDAVITSKPIKDTISGNTLISEAHVVTTFYVLNEPSGGWIAFVFNEQEFYQNYH